MGEGPDGGAGPAEAGPEMGDSWVLWPGGLIRPWSSSILAWPGKCCVKSGLHTVKGHGGPRSRHGNGLEAWKNQA